MQLSVKKILLIAFMSSGFSCAHEKPYSDIAATNIAIEYMTKSNAVKKAPNLFRKAMKYYTQANELLVQKENKSAQKYLHLARIYAEKAEFKSRTKIQKTQEEW